MKVVLGVLTVPLAPVNPLDPHPAPLAIRVPPDSALNTAPSSAIATTAIWPRDAAGAPLQEHLAPA
jgi:hypothetical protein